MRKRPPRDSKFRTLIDAFMILSAIAQVGGLIVVWLTLQQYKRANEITEETLELGRKQYSDTKLPFLSVDLLGVTLVDDQKLQVAYDVVNNSDTPATITGYVLTMSNLRPDLVIDHNKKDWITPHERRHRAQTVTIRVGELASVYNAIMAGAASFTLQLKCEDMFHRASSITYSFEFAERTRTFGITNIAVEGL